MTDTYLYRYHILGLAPQSTSARKISSKGFTDEARLKGMEEARKTALEMAQEENAPTEETAQAAEAVGLIQFILWEHGVVRYPRGLQLLSHSPSPVGCGMRTNGYADLAVHGKRMMSDWSVDPSNNDRCSGPQVQICV